MTSPLQTCVNVRVGPRGAVSRRGFLRRLAAGRRRCGLRLADHLGACAGELKKQGRACILLWMAGGPASSRRSILPGAETQGPTR
jgi:hypothetical protein